MTPEKALWQAVVLRMAEDATFVGDGSPSSTRQQDRRDAQRWFARAGKDFHEVCELAGLNPEFVSEAANDGRIDGEALRRRKGRIAAE